MRSNLPTIRYLLLIWAIVLPGLALFGQEGSRTITGVISDESMGEPIIGANVLVRGTSLGTVTDFDGKFELNVAAGAKVLVVSYVGYRTKKVPLKPGKNEYMIKMSDQVELDQVVVTALGIEREEKALGYSVQQLSADQIATVKPTNVTNALAGKVSGVYVTGSSSSSSTPMARQCPSRPRRTTSATSSVPG